jgi:hypothetical protein
LPCADDAKENQSGQIGFVSREGGDICEGKEKTFSTASQCYSRGFSELETGLEIVLELSS